MYESLDKASKIFKIYLVEFCFLTTPFNFPPITHLTNKYTGIYGPTEFLLRGSPCDKVLQNCLSKLILTITKITSIIILCYHKTKGQRDN